MLELCKKRVEKPWKVGFGNEIKIPKFADVLSCFVWNALDLLVKR